MSAESWAICELMGHVRLAGRLSEEQRFGTVLGRIDIPQPEYPCQACNGTGKVLPLETGSTCPECDGTGKIGGGFVTQLFGGQSVYRITPTTEEAARAEAARMHAPPAYAWDARKALAAPVADEDDYDDFDDDRR